MSQEGHEKDVVTTTAVHVNVQQVAHTVKDESKTHQHLTPRTTTVYVTGRRLATGFVACGWIFLFMAPHYSDIFQYHPMAMTLSCMCVLPEVVHQANNFRRCRSVSDRASTTDRHTVSALAMKTLTLVGFAAIEISKFQRKKQHFTTWHGLLGLLTVLTLTLQILVGVLYRYRLGPSQRIPNFFIILRKAHKWFGLILVALVASTMFLGFQSHFAMRVLPGSSWRLVGGALTAAVLAFAYWVE
jgi:cytochrome b-561 domain-containing protein 2